MKIEEITIEINEKVFILESLKTQKTNIEAATSGTFQIAGKIYDLVEEFAALKADAITAITAEISALTTEIQDLCDDIKTLL